MNHHCHALGCQVNTKPELLMCPRHWAMVPKRMQRPVWKTYRIGQCDDKQPSAAWFLAAETAICAVAWKEGRLTVEQCRERIARYREDAEREQHGDGDGTVPS